MKLLTPNDIHNATFTVHYLRGGYDTDQVDDLLDQAAATIAVLWAELQTYRNTI
ncbi:hypothetical protein D2E25_0276 [Bifidobacterium goeldii]|uniref:Cell wall synthesis protein Wag31 n=1 Tax=Bifidobacterium goeldii TaxID=2306975 RepID=A0A430FMG9_9BIFI|nr:DivIVA domain-containing protein [Bifidobacterium goeldii]RSX53970.1 hypothetical protein D2E25_0276 [Bifidobacterium goeldii]